MPVLQRCLQSRAAAQAQQSRYKEAEFERSGLWSHASRSISACGSDLARSREEVVHGPGRWDPVLAQQRSELGVVANGVHQEMHEHVAACHVQRVTAARGHGDDLLPEVVV